MNDPAASTGSSSSHDAREKIDALIAEIRALGHLPTQRKQPKDEAEAAETRLARRLQKAKQHAEWSSQYDTRLEEIANGDGSTMAEVQPAHEAGAEEIISEIKALGRLPRQLKKATTEAEAVMLLQLLLMLLLLLPLLLLVIVEGYFKS